MFGAIHLKAIAEQYDMSQAHWSPVRAAFVKAGVFVKVEKTCFGDLADIRRVIQCKREGEDWYDAAVRFREQIRRDKELAYDRLLDAVRDATRVLTTGDADSARIILDNALEDF